MLSSFSVMKCMDQINEKQRRWFIAKDPENVYWSWTRGEDPRGAMAVAIAVG